MSKTPAVRVSGLRFVNAVPIAGEVLSVRIGPQGNVTRILPCRIGEGGQPLPLTGEQRSDGWLIVRKYQDRLNNVEAEELCVVGWANVATVSYLPEAPEKAPEKR